MTCVCAGEATNQVSDALLRNSRILTLFRPFLRIGIKERGTDPITGSDRWNGTIHIFWNRTNIGIKSRLNGSYPSLVESIYHYTFTTTCTSFKKRRNDTKQIITISNTLVNNE